MLDAAGFEQMVVSPTYRKDHTLDLVVVWDDLSVRGRPEIIAFPNSVSDHSAIICDVDMPKPCASKKILYRRPLRKINLDSWCNDIRDSAIYSSASSDDSDCNVLCDQTGDFNFHIDDPGDADAVRLLGMLDAAGFEQMVVSPTYRKDHTLDLVVVWDGDLSVRGRPEIIAFPNSVSDHSAIICDVDMPKPCASKKILLRRPLRKINLDSWCNDIRDSAIYSSASSDDSDCNVLCDQYNTVLHHFIDKHAPVRTFSVTLRPYSPWYDDSLRLLKRQKRKVERRYVSSRLEIHRQMYVEKCRAYSTALNVAKRNFSKDQISCSNQTQLFRLIDGLFRVKPVPLLPSYESPQALAEDFILFFTTKIQHLKDNLRSSPLLTMEMSVMPAQPQCVASFPEFSAVSVSYIRELLHQSKPKSCILDPVPTSILKQSIDAIAPAITSIVNASLSSGVFPTSLDCGVINPSIKKQSLDREAYPSYRPITNVAFPPKTLERVAANQTMNYLIPNDLMLIAPSTAQRLLFFASLMTF
ncbi:uncharacterized protein LOC125568284 [Nematostella vectensis]|uniref:uncharacterized protein LOC125568284 n=1 Tax=Nematostella vectensis TaxID=45351 RepID=UPI00207704D6|nr:uncharacterized protein LOC125568284 [Nematostella vectensis]